MAAGMIGGAHIDGTSFQVSRLAVAKGLLDFRQVLVAVMDDLFAGGALKEVGFQNVSAVHPRDLIQSWLIHGQLQRSPCDFNR